MDFSVLLKDLRDVADKYQGKSTEPQVSTHAYADMFTKILKRAQKVTEEYDDQITVLWVALNQLASIYKDLSPGAARDQLCKFIFGMCAKTVLHIQWAQLDEDSKVKKNFSTTVEDVNKILSQLGFHKFQLILDLMESHWTHPMLSKIMSGEDEDTDDCLEYIEQEDPDVLKLRIEIMMKENCEEFALNLCNWSLKHAVLCNDLKIKEHQIYILYRQQEYGKMQEVCETIICHDGIKVMSHLAKTPTNQELCIRLAQVFLIQDWVKPERTCCTQELLKLWIHHQYLADKDEERFLESIWIVAKMCRDTEQIGVLIDGVKKECGDMFIQLYSELCKYAINIDKGNMERVEVIEDKEEFQYRKLGVSKTCVRMAFMLKEYDFRISRICGLTAFSLDPTMDNLNLVNKLYWTIKNVSATSENSKINIATLYEIERLLGQLRPEILNPEFSWKQLIPVCKKYKLDFENEKKGMAVKNEHNGVGISSTMGHRQTAPIPDIILTQKSDLDLTKKITTGQKRVRQTKSKEIPKDIQKAHLAKLLGQKNMPRDEIERVLSDKFPRNVPQDFGDAPPLDMKELDKTINDLKKSIYLETQYREKIKHDLSSLQQAKKSSDNTGQSSTGIAHQDDHASRRDQFEQQQNKNASVHRQHSAPGLSRGQGALLHRQLSDATPLPPTAHSHHQRQQQMSPVAVYGSSPPPAHSSTNRISSPTNYSSSLSPTGPRPPIAHPPNLGGNRKTNNFTYTPTSQKRSGTVSELCNKIKTGVQHQSHNSKKKKISQFNILRPPGSSKQECAKIAQQIAEMHERQRAERADILETARLQGQMDGVKAALNSRNIASRSQISDLLSMTFHGNKGPNTGVQGNVIAEGDAKKGRSYLKKKSDHPASVSSSQQLQNIPSPQQLHRLSASMNNPNVNSVGSPTYSKPNPSSSMSNPISTSPGKYTDEHLGMKEADKPSPDTVMIPGEEEWDASRGIMKQKYYYKTGAHKPEEHIVNTGDSSLTMKPVYSMIVPRELTNPNRKDELVKTVTNMMKQFPKGISAQQKNVMRTQSKIRGISASVAGESTDTMTWQLQSNNNYANTGNVSQNVTNTLNNQSNLRPALPNTTPCSQSNFMSGLAVSTPAVSQTYVEEGLLNLNTLAAASVSVLGQNSNQQQLVATMQLPQTEQQHQIIGSPVIESQTLFSPIQSVQQISQQPETILATPLYTMPAPVIRESVVAQQMAGMQSNVDPRLQQPMMQQLITVHNQTMIGMANTQQFVNVTGHHPATFQLANVEPVSFSSVSQSMTDGVSHSISGIPADVSSPSVGSQNQKQFITAPELSPALVQQILTSLKQSGNRRASSTHPSQSTIKTAKQSMSGNHSQKPSALNKSVKDTVKQMLALKNDATGNQSLVEARQRIIQLRRQFDVTAAPQSNSPDLANSSPRKQLEHTEDSQSNCPDIENTFLRKQLEQTAVSQLNNLDLENSSPRKHLEMADSQSSIPDLANISPTKSMPTSLSNTVASPRITSGLLERLMSEEEFNKFKIKAQNVSEFPRHEPHACAKSASVHVTQQQTLPELPDLGAKEFQIDSLLALDNDSTVASENTVQYTQQARDHVGKSKTHRQVSQSEIEHIQDSFQVESINATAVSNTSSDNEMIHGNTSLAQSTYLNANRLGKERENREVINQQEDMLEIKSLAKKTVECVKCDMYFQTEDHLADHKNISHCETKWQCGYCNMVFKCSEILKTHEKNYCLKAPSAIVRCYVCGVYFQSHEQLKAHLSPKTCSPPTIANGTQEIKEDIVCGICDRKFVSMNMMKEHVKLGCMKKDAVSLEKLKNYQFSTVLSCSKCNFLSQNENIASKHVDKCRENNITAKLNSLFKCNMCEELLNTEEETYRHVSRQCPKLKVTTTQRQVQSVYHKLKNANTPQCEIGENEKHVEVKGNVHAANKDNEIICSHLQAANDGYCKEVHEHENRTTPEMGEKMSMSNDEDSDYKGQGFSGNYADKADRSSRKRTTHEIRADKIAQQKYSEIKENDIQKTDTEKNTLAQPQHKFPENMLVDRPKQDQMQKRRESDSEIKSNVVNMDDVVTLSAAKLQTQIRIKAEKQFLAEFNEIEKRKQTIRMKKQKELEKQEKQELCEIKEREKRLETERQKELLVQWELERKKHNVLNEKQEREKQKFETEKEKLMKSILGNLAIGQKLNKEKKIETSLNMITKTADKDGIIKGLKVEKPDRKDIAMYNTESHVNEKTSSKYQGISEPLTKKKRKKDKDAGYRVPSETVVKRILNESIEKIHRRRQSEECTEEKKMKWKVKKKPRSPQDIRKMKGLRAKRLIKKKQYFMDEMEPIHREKYKKEREQMERHSSVLNHSSLNIKIRENSPAKSAKELDREKRRASAIKNEQYCLKNCRFCDLKHEPELHHKFFIIKHYVKTHRLGFRQISYQYMCNFCTQTYPSTQTVQIKEHVYQTHFEGILRRVAAGRYDKHFEFRTQHKTLSSRKPRRSYGVAVQSSLKINVNKHIRAIALREKCAEKLRKIAVTSVTDETDIEDDSFDQHLSNVSTDSEVSSAVSREERIADVSANIALVSEEMTQQKSELGRTHNDGRKIAPRLSRHMIKDTRFQSIRANIKEAEMKVPEVDDSSDTHVITRSRSSSVSSRSSIIASTKKRKAAIAFSVRVASKVQQKRFSSGDKLLLTRSGRVVKRPEIDYVNLNQSSDVGSGGDNSELEDSTIRKRKSTRIRKISERGKSVQTVSSETDESSSEEITPRVTRLSLSKGNYKKDEKSESENQNTDQEDGKRRVKRMRTDQRHDVESVGEKSGGQVANSGTSERERFIRHEQIITRQSSKNEDESDSETESNYTDIEHVVRLLDAKIQLTAARSAESDSESTSVDDKMKDRKYKLRRRAMMHKYEELESSEEEAAVPIRKGKRRAKVIVGYNFELSDEYEPLEEYFEGRNRGQTKVDKLDSDSTNTSAINTNKAKMNYKDSGDKCNQLRVVETTQKPKVVLIGPEDDDDLNVDYGEYEQTQEMPDSIPSLKDSKGHSSKYFEMSEDMSKIEHECEDKTGETFKITTVLIGPDDGEFAGLEPSRINNKILEDNDPLGNPVIENEFKHELEDKVKDSKMMASTVMDDDEFEFLKNEHAFETINKTNQSYLLSISTNKAAYDSEFVRYAEEERVEDEEDSESCVESPEKNKVVSDERKGHSVAENAEERMSLTDVPTLVDDVPVLPPRHHFGETLMAKCLVQKEQTKEKKRARSPKQTSKLPEVFIGKFAEFTEKQHIPLMRPSEKLKSPQIRAAKVVIEDISVVRKAIEMEMTEKKMIVECETSTCSVKLDRLSKEEMEQHLPHSRKADREIIIFDDNDEESATNVAEMNASEPAQRKTSMKPAHGKIGMKPEHENTGMKPGYGRTGMKPGQRETSIETEHGRMVIKPEQARTGMKPGQGEMCLKLEQEKIGMKSEHGKTSIEPKHGKMVTKTEQARIGMKPCLGKMGMKLEQGNIGMELEQGITTMKLDQAKTGIKPELGKMIMKPEQGKIVMKSEQARSDMNPGQGKMSMKLEQGKMNMKPEQGKMSMKPEQGKIVMKSEQALSVINPGQRKMSMKLEQGKTGMKPGQGIMGMNLDWGKTAVKSGQGKLGMKPEQCNTVMKRRSVDKRMKEKDSKDNRRRDIRSEDTQYETLIQDIVLDGSIIEQILEAEMGDVVVRKQPEMRPVSAGTDDSHLCVQIVLGDSTGLPDSVLAVNAQCEISPRDDPNPDVESGNVIIVIDDISASVEKNDISKSVVTQKTEKNAIVSTGKYKYTVQTDEICEVTISSDIGKIVEDKVIENVTRPSDCSNRPERNDQTLVKNEEVPLTQKHIGESITNAAINKCEEKANNTSTKHTENIPIDMDGKTKADVLTIDEAPITCIEANEANEAIEDKGYLIENIEKSRKVVPAKELLVNRTESIGSFDRGIGEIPGLVNTVQLITKYLGGSSDLISKSSGNEEEHKECQDHSIEKENSTTVHTSFESRLNNSGNSRTQDIEASQHSDIDQTTERNTLENAVFEIGENADCEIKSVDICPESRYAGTGDKDIEKYKDYRTEMKLSILEDEQDKNINEYDESVDTVTSEAISKSMHRDYSNNHLEESKFRSEECVLLLSVESQEKCSDEAQIQDCFNKQSDIKVQSEDAKDKKVHSSTSDKSRNFSQQSAIKNTANASSGIYETLTRETNSDQDTLTSELENKSSKNSNALEYSQSEQTLFNEVGVNLEGILRIGHDKERETDSDQISKSETDVAIDSYTECATQSQVQLNKEICVDKKEPAIVSHRYENELIIGTAEKDCTRNSLTENINSAIEHKKQLYKESCDAMEIGCRMSPTEYEPCNESRIDLLKDKIEECVGKSDEKPVDAPFYAEQAVETYNLAKKNVAEKCDAEQIANALVEDSLSHTEVNDEIIIGYTNKDDSHSRNIDLKVNSHEFTTYKSINGNMSANLSAEYEQKAEYIDIERSEMIEGHNELTKIRNEDPNNLSISENVTQSCGYGLISNSSLSAIQSYHDSESESDSDEFDRMKPQIGNSEKNNSNTICKSIKQQYTVTDELTAEQKYENVGLCIEKISKSEITDTESHKNVSVAEYDCILNIDGIGATHFEVKTPEEINTENTELEIEAKSNGTDMDTETGVIVPEANVYAASVSTAFVEDDADTTTIGASVDCRVGASVSVGRPMETCAELDTEPGVTTALIELHEASVDVGVYNTEMKIETSVDSDGVECQKEIKVDETVTETFPDSEIVEFEVEMTKPVEHETEVIIIESHKSEMNENEMNMTKRTMESVVVEHKSEVIRTEKSTDSEVIEHITEMTTPRTSTDSETVAHKTVIKASETDVLTKVVEQEEVNTMEVYINTGTVGHETKIMTVGCVDAEFVKYGTEAKTAKTLIEPEDIDTTMTTIEPCVFSEVVEHASEKTHVTSGEDYSSEIETTDNRVDVELDELIDTEVVEHGNEPITLEAYVSDEAVNHSTDMKITPASLQTAVIEYEVENGSVDHDTEMKIGWHCVDATIVEQETKVKTAEVVVSELKTPETSIYAEAVEYETVMKSTETCVHHTNGKHETDVKTMQTHVNYAVHDKEAEIQAAEIVVDSEDVEQRTKNKMPETSVEVEIVDHDTGMKCTQTSIQTAVVKYEAEDKKIEIHANSEVIDLDTEMKTTETCKYSKMVKLENEVKISETHIGSEVDDYETETQDIEICVDIEHRTEMNMLNTSLNAAIFDLETEMNSTETGVKTTAIAHEIQAKTMGSHEFDEVKTTESYVGSDIIEHETDVNMTERHVDSEFVESEAEMIMLEINGDLETCAPETEDVELQTEVKTSETHVNTVIGDHDTGMEDAETCVYSNVVGHDSEIKTSNTHMDLKVVAIETDFHSDSGLVGLKSQTTESAAKTKCIEHKTKVRTTKLGIDCENVEQAPRPDVSIEEIKLETMIKTSGTVDTKTVQFETEVQTIGDINDVSNEMINSELESNITHYEHVMKNEHTIIEETYLHIAHSEPFSETAHLETAVDIDIEKHNDRKDGETVCTETSVGALSNEVSKSIEINIEAQCNDDVICEHISTETCVEECNDEHVEPIVEKPLLSNVEENEKDGYITKYAIEPLEQIQYENPKFRCSPRRSLISFPENTTSSGGEKKELEIKESYIDDNVKCDEWAQSDESNTKGHVTECLEITYGMGGQAQNFVKPEQISIDNQEHISELGLGTFSSVDETESKIMEVELVVCDDTLTSVNCDLTKVNETESEDNCIKEHDLKTFEISDIYSRKGNPNTNIREEMIEDVIDECTIADNRYDRKLIESEDREMDGLEQSVNYVKAHGNLLNAKHDQCCDESKEQLKTQMAKKEETSNADDAECKLTYKTGLNFTSPPESNLISTETVCEDNSKETNAKQMYTNSSTRTQKKVTDTIKRTQRRPRDKSEENRCYKCETIEKKKHISDNRKERTSRSPSEEMIYIARLREKTKVDYKNMSTIKLEKEFRKDETSGTKVELLSENSTSNESARHDIKDKNITFSTIITRSADKLHGNELNVLDSGESHSSYILGKTQRNDLGIGHKLTEMPCKTCPSLESKTFPNACEIESVKNAGLNRIRSVDQTTDSAPSTGNAEPLLSITKAETTSNERIGSGEEDSLDEWVKGLLNNESEGTEHVIDVPSFRRKGMIVGGTCLYNKSPKLVRETKTIYVKKCSSQKKGFDIDKLTGQKITKVIRSEQKYNTLGPIKTFRKNSDYTMTKIRVQPNKKLTAESNMPDRVKKKLDIKKARLSTKAASKHNKNIHTKINDCYLRQTAKKAASSISNKKEDGNRSVSSETKIAVEKDENKEMSIKNDKNQRRQKVEATGETEKECKTKSENNEGVSSSPVISSDESKAKNNDDSNNIGKSDGHNIIQTTSSLKDVININQIDNKNDIEMGIDEVRENDNAASLRTSRPSVRIESNNEHELKLKTTAKVERLCTMNDAQRKVSDHSVIVDSICAHNKDTNMSDRVMKPETMHSDLSAIRTKRASITSMKKGRFNDVVSGIRLQDKTDGIGGEKGQLQVIKTFEGAIRRGKQIVDRLASDGSEDDTALENQDNVIVNDLAATSMKSVGNGKIKMESENNSVSSSSVLTHSGTSKFTNTERKDNGMLVEPSENRTDEVKYMLCNKLISNVISQHQTGKKRINRTVKVRGSDSKKCDFSSDVQRENETEEEFRRRTETVRSAMRKSAVKPYESDFNFEDSASTGQVGNVASSTFWPSDSEKQLDNFDTASLYSNSSSGSSANVSGHIAGASNALARCARDFDRDELPIHKVSNFPHTSASTSASTSAIGEEMTKQKVQPSTSPSYTTIREKLSKQKAFQVPLSIANMTSSIEEMRKQKVLQVASTNAAFTCSSPLKTTLSTMAVKIVKTIGAGVGNSRHNITAQNPVKYTRRQLAVHNLSLQQAPLDHLRLQQSHVDNLRLQQASVDSLRIQQTPTITSKIKVIDKNIIPNTNNFVKISAVKSISSIPKSFKLTKSNVHVIDKKKNLLTKEGKFGMNEEKATAVNQKLINQNVRKQPLNQKHLDENDKHYKDFKRDPLPNKMKTLRDLIKQKTTQDKEEVSEESFAIAKTLTEEVKILRTLHKDEKPFRWETSPSPPKKLRSQTKDTQTSRTLEANNKGGTESGHKEAANNSSDINVASEKSIIEATDFINTEHRYLRDRKKEYSLFNIVSNKVPMKKNEVVESTKSRQNEYLTSEHDMRGRTRSRSGSKDKCNLEEEKSDSKHSEEENAAKSKRQDADKFRIKPENARIVGNSTIPKLRNVSRENVKNTVNLEQTSSEEVETKMKKRKNSLETLRKAGTETGTLLGEECLEYLDEEPVQKICKLDGTSSSPGKHDVQKCAHKVTIPECDSCKEMKLGSQNDVRPAVRKVFHGGKVFEIQKGCITETDLQYITTKPGSDVVGPLCTQINERVKKRSKRIIDRQKRTHSPEEVVDINMNDRTTEIGILDINRYISETLKDIKKQREGNIVTKWTVQKRTRRTNTFPYSFKKSK